MEGIKIILLGPPGVGKGTIAEMLTDESGAVHLSTGDMLREEVKRGTEKGRLALGFMNSGGLVPDELVISILKNRIMHEGKEKGFVLDGFPRTINQAEALEAILSEAEMAPDFVLNLQAPEDVIIQRLSGRLQCSDCSRIYHEVNMPPKNKNVCDDCGGKLFQREDDRKETVKVRLKNYELQTSPLIDFYAAGGLLKKIKADVGPLETFEEVKRQINI